MKEEIFTALGEVSAVFMSQPIKGTEIVMPEAELTRIGNKLLEKVDKPNLGLATTRQLLAEITARIEVDGQLDYRTVDKD